jgi:hypothetical protein
MKPSGFFLKNDEISSLVALGWNKDLIGQITVKTALNNVGCMKKRGRP